ncbi:sensor histidine kinase [Phytoactinopolyspora limicola]|uniref:sensor histidine kinase n=1 Tax=Phytoactinopolyspora limicola TaxID=2715536 RepID=UPI00140A6154|nr:sensor histidine kinase [Phytoactinopolyspora limicola]
MSDDGPHQPRPWSGRAGDTWLTLATALLVIGGTAVTGANDVSVVGWILMAAASAAVFFRRDYPIAVAVFTLVTSAIYLVMPDRDGPIIVAFAIALYTVMAAGRFAAGILIGATAVVAAFYGEYATDTENLGDLGVVFFASWLVSVMAIGGAIHSRRAYLREMEQAREEEVRRRTTEERLRIAHEVHDVLGHTISLINVQASAALHRLPKDPGQATEALSTIKASSHEALRELRSTLGGLRDVDGAAPMAPAPTLGRVGELVDRTSSADLSVALEVEGAPRELTPAVDLAGYRIVQEALTNVTRHSGARAANVRIAYGDDTVRVEITDDGSGATPDAGDGDGWQGSGIIGMRERADSVGGELSAGPSPDGGFVVRARLPIGGVR